MLAHKHPLENPTLAPLNLRTKLSWQRLQWVPTIGFTVFEERMIARFWEKRNRLSAPRPLPAAEIIHTILPHKSRKNRIKTGDFIFGGLPYLTRDIVTLSSVVQWFGTNVGRCFIEEPLRRLESGYRQSEEFATKFRKMHEDRDMYAFLAHRCTSVCNNPRIFRLAYESCIFDSQQISARDKAVVDGLMVWLGTEHGRQFFRDFHARRGEARADADRRSNDFFARRRTFKALKAA